MLRIHCFAGWFRDVFSAHSQPLVRHIFVLRIQFPACGDCAQWLLRHWPTLVSLQSPSHTSCSGHPSLLTLRTLLLAMTFCFRVYAFRVSSQRQHACARRLSSLLATGPVRVRDHCQLPLPLAFQIPGKPFKLGKAILNGTRHLLALLLSNRVLLVSARSCSANIQSPSQAR